MYIRAVIAKWQFRLMSPQHHTLVLCAYLQDALMVGGSVRFEKTNFKKRFIGVFAILLFQ